MRHGSLFSGIGGFDLASEWMGWANMFHCEWNQFGQKVLKYYWPEAISYDDICKTDFTIWRGKIDILTGGFPCQPYSMAGKRKGTEDSRHLWPEMLRAIRECRPTWIVGENVPGLINWSGGLVFEQVCLDLEGEGYEVQPVVLPASGVNAPHRRDRVWFVAYRNDTGARNDNNGSNGIGKEINERWKELTQPEFGQTFSEPEWIVDEWSTEVLPPLIKNPNWHGRGGDERKEESSIGRFGDIGAGDNERVRTDHAEIGTIPDYHSEFRGERRKTGRGQQPRHREGMEESNGMRNDANASGTGQQERNTANITNGQRHSAWRNPTDWTDWPTVAPLCNGNDGISERLDGITFPKWRNESIKAGGNAVVVPLVYQIFKTIEAYEISIQTKKG